MIEELVHLGVSHAEGYSESSSVATKILAPSIAALLGALFGALFSRGIPAGWSAPRLRIDSIDGHASFCRVIVNNVGRTAAKSTASRITVLAVDRENVVDLRTDSWVPPERRTEPERWFRSKEAFRRRSSIPEAGTDITGGVHWAIVPNPIDVLIRPQLHETLDIAFFDGQFLRIASEDLFESRVVLDAGSSQVYRVDLIASAENSRPCRCSLTFHVKGDRILISGRSGRRSLGPVELLAPTDM